MRIFITIRPNIQTEIRNCLVKRVKGVSQGTHKDYIIEYLHLRFNEDEIPDAMDKSLDANIVKKISENISERYV